MKNKTQETETYLLKGLNLLKQKHSLNSDVKSNDLFVSESLKTIIKWALIMLKLIKLLMHLREIRVLINSDSPSHNVLKIQPARVFNN